MTATLRIFPTREELAETLAGDVADALERAIAMRGRALLAVSGGSTPGRFFDALSKRQLDWQNVIVTLVDERFTPPTSDRSNEKLARERLLVNAARLARFIPLYSDAGSAEAAATQAQAALALFGGAPDVAILGMGGDGHTASFFPDAAELESLLAPENPAGVLPVHAKSAGEPRLTLPLSRLLEAPLLAVHIEGQEKRDVLDKALEPAAAFPISAVFTHASKPVPVYWAS